MVDRYFTWTTSRLQGIDLEVIAQEALKRHHHAFPDRPRRAPAWMWGRLPVAA
ncbi:MAG: hypothetical protein LVS60_01525 [Nodosilinea sp. LVE1205-7]